MPGWGDVIVKSKSEAPLLKYFHVLRQPGILPDGFQPAAHAACRARLVKVFREKPNRDREEPRKSYQQHGDRRVFLCRSLEFPGEQQSDAATYGSLRNGDDARSG